MLIIVFYRDSHLIPWFPAPLAEIRVSLVHALQTVTSSLSSYWERDSHLAALGQGGNLGYELLLPKSFK